MTEKKPTSKQRHYASSAKSDKAHVEKLARQQRALELRIAGMTYSQIGDAIGVGRATAYKYYREALGELLKENVEKMEELRQLELARLDHLQREAETVLRKSHVYVSQGGKIVYDGDVKLVDDGPTMQAIATVLRIMERRSKLLGLDQPTKIEQSGSVEVTTGYDLSKITDPDDVRKLMELLAKAETGEEAGE